MAQRPLDAVSHLAVPASRSLLKSPGRSLACLAGCSGTWDDSVMQGFERAGGEVLDAAALARHLVPGGSMFAVLAAPRREVVPPAHYAEPLGPPGAGRPAPPA